MAVVVSFSDVLRARRRAREREHTALCVQILEANLRLALHLFTSGPVGERPVRARQVRQLAELLEYVVEREP
jgi:hypothetical protein